MGVGIGDTHTSQQKTEDQHCNNCRYPDDRFVEVGIANVF